MRRWVALLAAAVGAAAVNIVVVIPEEDADDADVDASALQGLADRNWEAGVGKRSESQSQLLRDVLGGWALAGKRSAHAAEILIRPAHLHPAAYPKEHKSETEKRKFYAMGKRDEETEEEKDTIEEQGKERIEDGKRSEGGTGPHKLNCNLQSGKLICSLPQWIFRQTGIGKRHKKFGNKFRKSEKKLQPIHHFLHGLRGLNLHSLGKRVHPEAEGVRLIVLPTGPDKRHKTRARILLG